MKLDKFPKALWINLDKSIDRRRHMEKLLSDYNIEHIRIPAIDGTNPNNVEYKNICIPNNTISAPENACTCSHIKALKYFTENMEDDLVIIFEDDVSFEFLKFIPFNWSDLNNNFPKKYNVIQLAIINGSVNNYLIKSNPEMRYFSAAAYLITKAAAKKILEKYYDQKLNIIDLSKQGYGVADLMIFSIGDTYSIPIFTYLIADSTIHPDHVESHKEKKDTQLDMWVDITKNISTFDINKYFSKFEK